MDTRIIEAVTQLEPLFAARSRTNFELRLARLTAEQNEAWTAQLRRDYFACGCTEGARFMVAAMVVAAGAALFDLLGWITIDWTLTLIGLALLAIIAAAVIGKAIGLAQARRRLRVNTRRLMHLTEIECELP